MTLEPNPKYYKKISIGYNGQDDFFDSVITPFKDYISSVYTSPPTSMGIRSSRTTPDVSLPEMLRLRKKLAQIGIEFNLVYNFDGIADPKIGKDLLAAAHFFKPDLVTFPGTFVRDLFLKETDYKLNISIIHDINSLNQLEQVLEGDQDGQIVSYNIGRRKTFDLDFIREVKTKYPNLRLKLMVNEGCVFECPDQQFHSCSHSMMKKNFSDQQLFYCSKLESGQWWRFLSGQYIPPKFLSRYLGLVDEFKLASRGIYTQKMQTQRVVQLLEEYIGEQDISIKRAIESSYGGSLFARMPEFRAFVEAEQASRVMEALEKPYPEPFFQIRSKCLHNCQQCGYCKKVLYG